MQVKGAAGLGSCTGFSFPAEGLNTHHGPDHVAVHVDISCMRIRGDKIDGFIDPAMNTECESVAGRVDKLDQGIQLTVPESYYVKYRPEHLAFQFGYIVDLNQRRRKESTLIA